MAATIHPDVLELAELLRPAWAEMSADIPATHPRCEGDSDADADADKDADADDKDQSVDADKDADNDADKDEPDWKRERRESRKHERRAKAEKARNDSLQKEIDKLKASGKSDQEKAIEKAKEEAKAEAQSELDEERRGDRLEGAVLRLAAKGVKVGKGEDAKTVRFDDPEDALVFIERAVSRGDLPADTLYDDSGRPKTDVLTEELVDLLERKPALAANGGTKVEDPGDADAGKGKGKKPSEDMNDLMRNARNR